MTGIKITPLLLFVLLLVVLVISVAFGKMSNLEGFVAFHKNTPVLEKVWISQYSKDIQVHKLNDNLFFDSRNGNLIELDAEEYSDVAVVSADAADKVSEAGSMQTYPKDTAMIITTAGVETAVKTAAPYIKEIADKKMGVYMLPDVNVVPEAPSAPETAKEVAPEPANEVAPEPANEVATEPATEVATEPANEVATEPATTTETLTNQEDKTGITITRVIITPRNGASSTTYNITPNDIEPRDTNESRNTTVISSYKSWKYETQCANTSKKTVLYIPWKEVTYIIIVDKADVNSYSLYMFGQNNDVGHKSFSQQDISEIYTQTMLDETSNTLISEPLYNNEPVYKVSKVVEYDINRGNIVVIPSGQGEAVKIYNREGSNVEVSTILPSEKGSISNISFNPWIIKVGGKTTGFCMAYKDTTVICILNDNGLTNVKRFTPTGVDIEGVQTASATPQPVIDASVDSNYILKTEIVPPVCPSCPACPDNVTCTNCGGQGGSGTLATDGRSIVDEHQGGKRKGGLVREVVSGTTGLVRDAASGADELARDAVSGADDLARDAVGGTVGLAKDAVGGTVGLAKEVVGGTVGLAKDTVSGAAGLLTGAASGVAGLFKTNPMQLQTNSINQGGIINPNMQADSGRRPRGSMPQSVDNTNYFGALPNKPSTNYMPVTADFSAFSR